MAQMQFGRSGRIVLTMHTAVAASAAEWSTYLQALEGWVAEVDLGPKARTSIVFTDGAAPSIAQRRMFVEVMGDYRFRSAIVTTSRLTRGIVTALAWSTTGVRAFAPADVEGILGHAEIDSRELPTVLALGASMSSSLGGVQVFQTFAQRVTRQLDSA